MRFAAVQACARICGALPDVHGRRRRKIYRAKKIFTWGLTLHCTRAIIYKLNEYRGVEQLVARRAHNPEVVGSNPSPATMASVLTAFERL